MRRVGRVGSVMRVGKTKEALELIENSLKKYDKSVVACSFGKDSLVVLHLVKRVADKLGLKFDVLWNNTGVHYPDVYNVKDQLEDEWGLNIVETKAQKSFWEIVEEYGWPGVNSSDRSDKANSACCYHIKKKPTKDAIKENEWDLYFDGLTAYESDRRWMNLREYGLSHHHKTFNLQKVHPIGFWTVDDVWNYIDKHDIPYPAVYDNEVDNYTKRGYSEQMCGHRVDRAIRNGCWCCTLAIKSCPEKMEQLREYYPKMWRALMDKGLAEQIAKVKLGLDSGHEQGNFNFDSGQHEFLMDVIEDRLERQPCYFDKI